jgi:hypothetical protein
MNIILLHSHYDKEHLAEVKAEMVTLGAPTIRAIWLEMHGAWMALEGCHRIRAAKALGLTPEIEEINGGDYALDDEACDHCLDIDSPGTTMQDLIDDAHRQTMIEFED